MACLVDSLHYTRSTSEVQAGLMKALETLGFIGVSRSAYRAYSRPRAVISGDVRACAYVCARVRVCVRACACVCARARTCVRACAYVCACVRIGAGDGGSGAPGGQTSVRVYA